MDDPAVTALQRLIDSTPGGRAAVAAAIHGNEQTLYQIVAGVPLRSGKRRTVGRDLRERLNRAFPGWAGSQSPTLVIASDASATYVTPNHTRTEAHGMSLSPFKLPTQITWEQLMSAGKLPDSFCIAMPDTALLPRVSVGTILIFSTAKTAEAGDGILVEDRDGNRYVRRYTLVRPGHWLAEATNDAYRPLESQRDGLGILATLVGIMGSKL